MIDIFDKLNAAYGGHILADSDQIKDKHFNKKQEDLNKEILDDTDPTSIKSKVNSFSGIIIDPDNAVSAEKSDIEVGSSKIPTGNAVAGALNDVKELIDDGVYDVTARNAGSPTFESLDALLNDENLAILIPEAKRHGGMSIKFVQSIDNKYIQARCMAQNFTTDITQWQGVDKEPTDGSNSLIKSGGVFESTKTLEVNSQTPICSMIGGEAFPSFNNAIWERGSIDSSGNISATNRLRTKDYIRIKTGSIVNKTNVEGYGFGIVLYDDNKNYIGDVNYNNKTDYDLGNASYVRLIFRKNTDSNITVEDALGHECSLVFAYESVDEKISSLIKQTFGIAADKTISQKAITEKFNTLDGTTLDVLSDAEWHQGSYYAEINPNLTNRKYCVLPCVRGDVFKFIIPTSSWKIYVLPADNTGAIGTETLYSANTVLTIDQDNTGRVASELRITAVPVPDKTITDELWNTFDIICYKNGYIQNLIAITDDLKTIKTTTEIAISPTWHLGEVNRYGNIVPEETGVYYYSDAIRIDSGDRITIDTEGQGFAPLCLYIGDTLNSSYVVKIVYQGATSGVNHYEITAPFDCNLVLCAKNDTIPPVIHRYSNEIKYSELCKLCEVNVAAWNFGLFNNGVTPKGIPNADLDTTLPKVKELLVSLGAGILFATEIPLKVDRDGTIDLYAGLLQQFYPYYSMEMTADTTAMGLFSKYPINVSKYTATSGRNFIIGYAVIDGEKVGICVLHGVPGDDTTSSDRITDEQDVISYFADYEKVIIAGDFNTYEDSELDVFRNAGWVLGNCGYFGNIDTYKPSKREWYTDNIVTKNININSFSKADNRADVSDHYPVYSKISFFSN